MPDLRVGQRVRESRNWLAEASDLQEQLESVDRMLRIDSLVKSLCGSN